MCIKWPIYISATYTSLFISLSQSHFASLRVSLNFFLFASIFHIYSLLSCSRCIVLICFFYFCLTGHLSFSSHCLLCASQSLSLFLSHTVYLSVCLFLDCLSLCLSVPLSLARPFYLFITLILFYIHH